MTQEELAYAAGLAVRTIRNIESGDTRGSKTSRRLIAAALHTTPEELTKAVA
jgi:transcriptional regulator with XRE-family HTH domain